MIKIQQNIHDNVRDKIWEESSKESRVLFESAKEFGISDQLGWLIYSMARSALFVEMDQKNHLI